jgi:hypothetical protein
VAQVTFDLEIGIEAIGDGMSILQVAAKLPVQRCLGQVSDVRRHPGYG